MRRSFDNRIFGGVCGGLQALTRLDAWWWRIGFIALALLSQGLGLLAYLLLWWLLPAESPTRRVRIGLSSLLAWGLVLAVVGGYFLRAELVTESGVGLYEPLLLLALALVYLFKEVRVREGRPLWGLIAVGLALALLAYSLGWLPSGIADLLRRALPAVLVFVGLALLLRRRLPFADLVALALSALLTVGIGAAAFNSLSQRSLDENRQTIEEAISPIVTTLQVNLEALDTDVQVFAAPPDERLARLRYVGSLAMTIEHDYRDYGDGLATLTLREVQSDPFPSLESLGRATLQLELPQGLALAIAYRGARGTVSFDLQRLNLERLNAEQIEGDMLVSYPPYQPLSPSVAEQPGEIIVRQGNLRLLLADEVAGEFLISKAENQRPLFNDLIYALEDNLDAWRLVARRFNEAQARHTAILRVPRGAIRLDAPAGS
ncbi:MAG: PspC domain-containing protein [Anaerolineae bacterium]|nr:PspC domain-containing protein [Anaerolineae bacterium]MDW8173429.1 PspC domain-containing protein [Anaerolineae bacterium]